MPMTLTKKSGSGTQQKRIKLLIIDDDDVMREKMRRMLPPKVYQISEAPSGTSAKEMLVLETFDCVIVDHRLGDMDGKEIIAFIKYNENTPCPVIMVTGVGNERLAVQVMREGAYDYIAKDDLNVEYLMNAIAAGLAWARTERELQAMQKKLERLSLYDSLTALPNRQLFFDRLQQALLMSQRDHQRFAVLMMDLNLFKEINDTYGHEAGDDVLVEVSRRLQLITRVTDTFARIGGDEFAGILLNLKFKQDACLIAQKINEAIVQPMYFKSNSLHVGIAIGIAYFDGDAVDVRSILDEADRCMYKAKKEQVDYIVND